MLIRASEIPDESSAAFGVPAAASAWKALIIPTTVPKRPISTETEAIVDNKKFDKFKEKSRMKTKDIYKDIDILKELLI